MSTARVKVAEKILGEIMASEDYTNVLDILAQRESMPFLELSSLIDIDDDRLGEIVDDLERRGVVKVTSRDSILDEIVTLREDAAALASSAP